MGDRSEEIVDLTRGRPMPGEVQCAECPHPPFTGSGMWNDYARHLRTEHPQTIPTPPQREPEPPAAQEEPAPAGREEAPPMGEKFDECPRPGCDRPARHTGRHRNQAVSGNGGGPVAPVAEPAVDDLGYLNRIEGGDAHAAPPAPVPDEEGTRSFDPRQLTLKIHDGELRVALDDLAEELAKLAKLTVAVTDSDGNAVAEFQVIRRIELTVNGRQVVSLENPPVLVKAGGE